MRNPIRIIIFVAIILAIEFYAFKSLRLITSNWQKVALRNSVLIGYWLFSVVTYGFVIYAVYQYSRGVLAKTDYYLFFMGFGFLLLALLPKLIIIVFHLADDIIHLFRYIANYFIRNRTPAAGETSISISRWQFLTRVGWALAAIPFFGILYGMIKGRFDFRVETAKLKFPNLPNSANGLKVVHISDIHIGSFFNSHDAVIGAIEKINELEPDLILFTGDMVNNYADELIGWEKVLGKLKARMGKYSILGNHDYGDYADWDSEAAKAQNLAKLKDYHKKLGFKLLLNENVKFQTATNESFEIIGVENWGAGGFSKYGDLAKAMEGTNDQKFQLLMSHDPSHWDEQVIGKTKIDLTLSGHTHGMQFGVEIPGIIKWSPAKYRYKRWGGLYNEKEQFIYVNRGFGYIGFPGRVGIPPEITLIELNKA